MSISTASTVDAQGSIQLIASSLNAVASPVYAKGTDHRWLFANEACCKLLNTPREQLVGCFDHEVSAVIDADLLRSQDDNFFHSGTIANQPIHEHHRAPQAIVALKAVNNGILNPLSHLVGRGIAMAERFGLM